MSEKYKTKIALIPFQYLRPGMVTTLGKYIAEELTTALFNSGKFKIIERNLLNTVLDELKLSQTGAINPSSAKELGKVTGVDAVVVGTIQDLANRFGVNCRMIETESGEIFAAASIKIIKEEITSVLMEESKEEKPKKLVETRGAEKDELFEGIIGDYEFDLSNIGGVRSYILTIYVEDSNLWADDGDGRPAVLKSIGKEENRFIALDVNASAYELSFIKDKKGNYTKCHLLSRSLGLDFIGTKIDR